MSQQVRRIAELEASEGKLQHGKKKLEKKAEETFLLMQPSGSQHQDDTGRKC